MRYCVSGQLGPGPGLPPRCGTWSSFFVVLRAGRRTWSTIASAGRCGVPPDWVSPTPRFPGRPPVHVDVGRLHDRRHQVLTAVAARPGAVRKHRVPDEFDAFLLSRSDGARGWQAATPDDVFDFFCFVNTHDKGTKTVHVRSCPSVGSAGSGACLVGSGCAKGYAADSIALVSFPS